MNREQILAMDSYILLSLINMKLRDEFCSLENLCDDYDVEIDIITSKLKALGYIYNKNFNQFISEEV